MDGQRFDELSRLIASGFTRRNTLKGAAAAIIAASTARAATDQAGAQDLGAFARCKRPGQRCRKNSKCCRGMRCVDNECVYKNLCGGRKNDFCRGDRDCCDNFFCAVTQCQKCRGYACSKNGDCCNGFRCKRGKCK